MKIILHGVLPEAVNHRATCNYCKTVFEFTQSEAHVTYDQRDGPYLRIKCPVCERDVFKGILNERTVTKTR